MIYLDFTKAFDAVDKCILSHELKKNGISGSAGVWLYNFLSNRTQRIVTDDDISAPALVKSGVPQGTVLGPLLFIIMINSLTEVKTTSIIGMFAGDTWVGRAIRNEDDSKALQDDLNHVFNWQATHNMNFNTDKFEHVSHGREFKTNKNIPAAEYFTSDKLSIETKPVVRDIGIQISGNTNFEDQINNVCKMAWNKISWIFQTFYCREVKFLAFMWRIYIQPIIDYGCQLWAPCNQSDLKKLEGLFRNYTSCCDEIKAEKLNFWEHVHRFGISSQQRRHQRFRIICVWKVMEHLSPSCGLSWSNTDRTGRICSVPTPAPNASIRVQSLRDQSFQVQGPKLFNSLPWDLRNTTNCSLNSFKNKLDKFLAVFPDEPLTQKYYSSPLDRISGCPSNSIVDWARLLHVPTRREIPLDDIMKISWLEYISSDSCIIHAYHASYMQITIYF